MLSLFSMIASVAAEELDQAKGDSKEGFPSLDSCGLTKITFDPFVHKAVYTIGVHTNHGLETSFEETNTIFSDYLTATAGQKFDPPIQFHVLPSDFTEIFTAVENDEIDFLYSNAGVYSCIGTQAGATALATVVNSLTVRGQTFDLDVYGGVIAVRHDNTEINTITDLKDKIIGAGAIVDFMGGQLQVYEMGRAGMSYVNDPKQVVFTKDQARVVRGILDGTFDVGFIRTGQIEMTEDENGQLVDPDLFKIIEPKIFVMESGELFPFLHSTDIFPEWSFASLPSVPTDVQRVVQNALMDFQKYALIGEKNECIQGSTSLNETQLCDTLQDTTLIVPCDATDDLALVAAKAAKQSRISKFRTARSYFQIRSIQQEADFLIQDADGWHCARPANLYDGITCPEGYFKRNEGEYNNGCNMAGLSCDENEEYDCFCKPCVKAFEVDVYHLDDEEADPHLTDSMETFLPGCKKMQICATIEQRQSITMRIYDNMHRLGANVTVTVNAGEDRKTLVPTNIPGTVAYTFTVSDNEARVQVIEILVNGQPISQSPIRVMVDKAECDEDGNWIADSQGNCVCSGNTYDMAGSCLDSAAFFLIIFSAVFVTIGIILFFYLGYKKQQSDSVWHISVEELHFNEPPEIIGAGGFGVVILGQYRGTKVAVKRVLPPTKSLKGHIISISSGENVGVESVDVATGASTSIEAKKMSKKTKQDGKNRVKFGEATNSGDIESQRVCKSGSVQIQGSMSGSNKDWERFIMMHHSDNNILKILESATSSDHGSGDMLKGSASKSMVLLKYLPMWLRFDAHSRRVSEFVNEMRMLSRLRHPCITTVMGAVVTSAVDPMLGRCNTRRDLNL